jgi:para-aminobenzoate synthetase component I
MPRFLVRVLQRAADADPVRMLAALPADSRPVLLDSSIGGGASLLAWCPDRVVRGKITPQAESRFRWPLAQQDPAAALEQACANEQWELEDPSLPLVGGWIGYFGFECGHAWEPFPWTAPDPAGCDDYYFARYRNAVLFQPDGEALLLWAEDVDGGPDAGAADVASAVVPQAAGTADTMTADALRQQFAELCAAPPLNPEGAQLEAAPQPVESAESYQESVRQLRRWIGNGELFQANLSHRMEGPAPKDSRAFYASLRPRQPTSMSSYLETAPQRAMLSWSPESFLSVRGSQLRTQPIKGTAPRGSTSELDAQFAAELDASIKERAELNMIVDMARNDLGRVAMPGQVQVNTAGEVVPFPTLFHRVADVQARWDPSKGLQQLMRATFPPASVTGAPKVRALQAIAELEKIARGPYCGTFGYWLPGEPRGEFSVLIRTSTVADQRLQLRVGAGIVWDSDPLLEWQETLVKARYLTVQES